MNCYLYYVISKQTVILPNYMCININLGYTNTSLEFSVYLFQI